MSLRAILIFVVWAAVLCGLAAMNHNSDDPIVANYATFLLWCGYKIFACFTLVAVFLMRGDQRKLWISCCVFTLLPLATTIDFDPPPEHGYGHVIAAKVYDFSGSIQRFPQDEGEFRFRTRRWVLGSLINLSILSTMSMIGMFVGTWFTGRRESMGQSTSNSIEFN